MKTKIFIIVPSYERTGPIKGAAAIANILSKYYDVTFITLKDKKGIEDNLSESIKKINLHSKNWNIFYWIINYRKICRLSLPQQKIISISLCFSSDLVNCFSPKGIINISSIRANLIQDYKFLFGSMGKILSFIHFLILYKFKTVIAMTHEMSNQIKKQTKIQSVIIGNFIDEEKIKEEITLNKNNYLSKNDNLKNINLIFVGSLTKRKRPLLLAEAVHKITKKGINLHLTYVGDGPLKKNLVEFIKKNKLTNSITLTGILKNPYQLILNSDFFILPSESEGVSRAALEALFLGIPCLLRDTDGNKELIKENVNGLLFKNDYELVDRILLLINLEKKIYSDSLIPKVFTKKYAEIKYISLIESLIK
mgnify:CR=1 FL=1